MFLLTMNKDNIKHILDNEFEKLDENLFIKNDPIQIPYKFDKKEDIELSAFLTSILSFGKREIIIKKANELMNLMDNQPYNFLMKNNDFSKFSNFKHRTINGEDISYYLSTLKEIYEKYGGLEELFDNNIKNSLINFWQIFFQFPHDKRSEKHISNVNKNSAAKRLNMFLRWMVRNNKVDFGLWKNIKKENLYIPLDVHIANISRKYQIITRKSNDWKAVEQITKFLNKLNNKDPIKYDLVLFNLDYY